MVPVTVPHALLCCHGQHCHVTSHGAGEQATVQACYPGYGIACNSSGFRLAGLWPQEKLLQPAAEWGIVSQVTGTLNLTPAQATLARSMPVTAKLDSQGWCGCVGDGNH